MIYLSADNVPPIEPVGVQEVRTFLSMSDGDDSEDHFLSSAIAQVRESIEALVPLWLAKRMIVANFCSVPVITVRGSIATLYSVYGFTADGDEDITSECSMRTSAGSTRIHIPDPDRYDSVEVTFYPEPYFSESLNLAVLIGVRNLYQNRELNPVNDEVRRLIEPYLAVNI